MGEYAEISFVHVTFGLWAGYSTGHLEPGTEIWAGNNMGASKLHWKWY